LYAGQYYFVPEISFIKYGYSGINKYFSRPRASGIGHGQNANAEKLPVY